MDLNDVHYSLQELGYLLKQYLDQDIPSLHEELEAFRPTRDGLTAYDMLDFAIRARGIEINVRGEEAMRTVHLEFSGR